MRHRHHHDDPPAKRRPQPYQGPPVTLGHIRSHGVRRLLFYCLAIDAETAPSSCCRRRVPLPLHHVNG
jgi:hypothetical protein